MRSDVPRQMPDINTLIAAAWPNHIHHGQARRWLETETLSGGLLTLLPESMRSRMMLIVPVVM